MSDAQPTAGHKLTIKLRRDRLQIDLQSPLVALVSDLLDTLPNAFALARVIETMAADSTIPSTACDTDITDAAPNEFAFFDDKKYAFPNNDLDEQGTNVLDDSTLFGVVGDDNIAPPTQRQTTMLDLLGGWAATFFTGTNLMSEANRRLFSDELTATARKFIGLLNQSAAQAESTPDNGVTLDQAQNQGYTPDNPSPASSTAHDDVTASFGGGTNAKAENKPAQKVPEFVDIPTSGAPADLFGEASLSFTHDLPVVQHGFGDNRFMAQITVASTHPLETFPNLVGCLNDLVGKLYESTTPQVKYRSYSGDAAESDDLHMIRMPYVLEHTLPNNARLRITLTVTFTAFGDKHRMTNQLWRSLHGTRTQIAVIAAEAMPSTITD